jgi:hypothetical protein
MERRIFVLNVIAVNHTLFIEYDDICVTLWFVTKLYLLLTIKCNL